MDTISSGNSPSSSSSPSNADRGRRTSRRISYPQLNYESPGVWEALELLASIRPIELCREANIEHCRATRDLSSCGRYVRHVLSSCGHASLCAECRQRCDACPICRTAIPSGKGDSRCLRLYDKCIEVGLISKRYDDRFQDNKNDGSLLLADIQRLYHLFDVALENNLVSLVFHYITDVCMDEGAVSSDPMLAFLLDEMVVKEWCKQKFDGILSDLTKIYALKGDLDIESTSISKFGFLLTGLSNVLEVLVSSSVHASSEQLKELHHLLDSTLKAKQHLEIMSWCIKHNFLEDFKTRQPNFISWSTESQQRKSEAVKRAWHDAGNSLECNGSTLFIEDALKNLGVEQGCGGGNGDLYVSCLEEDHIASPFSISNSGVILGIYPFKNLRAAADVLFLRGTSETIVAKQAIFLYYLFDRHWTVHEVEWWQVIDDFAATLGIIRHSVLESLVFFLLDDHTEEALEEATRLLPEIVGPETHPKITQVLLQRQRPGLALTVLRCSGKEYLSGYTETKHESMQLVSLSEAVIAIRVRIECGLLADAFMYLRMHCTKAKLETMKDASQVAFSSNSKTEGCSWMDRVGVLVHEFCSLCMRRNLVDRMIELPWNVDEEKHLCNYLYKDACQNPSSTSGSLLVFFFLQRYRYIEAYRFDRKLQEIEHSFSRECESGSEMRQISQWRAGLVDKSIELLPEIQRLQINASKFDDADLFSSIADHHSDIPSSTGKPPGSSMVASSSMETPLMLQPTGNSLSRKETPAKLNTLSSGPRRLCMEADSPAAPSRVELVTLDSYGSPSTNHKVAFSVNGELSSNLCDGNISSSRSILSRGKLHSDVRKVLSRRKTAVSGKRTLFSTSDDANIFTPRRLSVKSAIDKEFDRRGGMRWRTFECSSLEEMDVDSERSMLDAEGSVLNHKHR